MFYPPVHLLVSICDDFSGFVLQRGCFLLVVGLKAFFMPSFVPRMSPVSDDICIQPHLPIAIGAFPSCPLRCGSCCSESRTCGYVGIRLVVQQC